jgi:aflatoxin B1 aldehyde reductase
MSGVKIVFGTTVFNPARPGGGYHTHEKINAVLDVLEKNGVKDLDTAQLYGRSKTFTGEVEAGNPFNIDTKFKGGFDHGNALKAGCSAQIGPPIG